jgi:fluoride exporter
MIGFLPVMLGGALGAGLRHAVGLAGLRLFGPGFPWWTLAVNCAGGLAMGLLMGTLARTGGAEGARLFLGVGMLGGFTTFSAFGLESWTMLERGQFPMAALYVTASVGGAVLLTGLGLWIARG